MYIEGTDGPDNLIGTDSDDVIVGKKGDDALFGFGGADLFTFYAGHDTGDGDGADVIDGGAGSDTFQVNADYSTIFTGRNSYVSAMTYHLHAGSGDGAALFTRSQDWANYATDLNGTYQSTVTLKSVENFSFIGTHDPAPPSSYPSYTFTNDDFTVGDLSSTGLTGQISFDGGSGDDTLDAHAASNTIVAYGGTGDDHLIGGSGSNTLYGQDGNDTLTDGSGSNTLVGGTGDDVYVVNSNSDTVVEMPNEGNDAVITTTSQYTLLADVENLFHSGTSDFTGVGNAGNNWIQGGPGNDYLIGLDGNDFLYGGAGANALQGGTGDDTYIVENPGDSPIEFANEGHDTVLTTLTQFTLLTNFEDLRYSGTGNFTGTGNDAANFIQGNVGNDHLIGLGGNDTLDDGGDGVNLLAGGTGDDLYIVGSSADTIVELANEGHDTVQTTLATFTLSANVEDLVTTLYGGGLFTGNDLANVIRILGAASTVDGGGGDDTLIGSTGNDVLLGGAGNDTLIGGLGGDELAGGSGADHFVFKTANDGADLIHDFSRAEGDRIDVSQLLSSLGPIGADPFGDGVLMFQPIAAFGSSGGPATRVLLDTDGSAGPAAPTTLFVALGGTAVVDSNDFIIT